MTRGPPVERSGFLGVLVPELRLLASGVSAHEDEPVQRVGTDPLLLAEVEVPHPAGRGSTGAPLRV